MYGWDTSTTELPGPVSRGGSPCCDRVPRHVRRSGSRQSLSLSQHRFLTLRRNKSFVSRQGLGLGLGALVETRVPLCCDRVFPGLSHSCHDRRFYVATGFAGVVLRPRVSCRDPQARPAHAIKHWARAQQAWGHA